MTSLWVLKCEGNFQYFMTKRENNLQINCKLKESCIHGGWWYGDTHHLSIFTPLQSFNGWKGTSRQDGSQSHERPRSSSKSTFALIVVLPSSLILPSHLYLTLSICLYLSLLSYAHSMLYSVDTHIFHMYRGFLPAPLPANKGKPVFVEGWWGLAGKRKEDGCL